MHPGSELSRARKQSGLTLRKLAAFADTSSAAISQIETGNRGVSFERLQSLLLLTRHRLVTIPTNAKTPDEVSVLIKRWLEAKENQHAYRALIVWSMTLKSLNPGVRVALTLNKPDSTGDPLYDAAIASVVQHWLSLDSLPMPEWATDDVFRLSSPTPLGESSSVSIPPTKEVPKAFLEHNVLISSDAIESLDLPNT